MPSALSDLTLDGFEMSPAVLLPEEIAALLSALGPVSGAGRRGLLSFPAIAHLARSERVLNLIRPHFPAEPLAVRALYFDKSPDANWFVAWHQDLSIAVHSRVEGAGFGPWTMKDGVPHVQPPVELLQQMITVRLHLDDADENNGALRVLPGSHLQGRLSAARIQELRKSQPEHLCSAQAGDALLMRPLLLHASGRSTSSKHRRVIHLEYAACSLPAGLEWHEGRGRCR